jgi:hypothetical protein
MSVLPEARESLTYWETRLQYLPWTAVRKRREAREMARRWRERVEEAERSQYGAGLLGALFMFYVERRLPASTRHRVVRAGKGAAVALAASAVALCVLALVALVALLMAIF